MVTHTFFVDDVLLYGNGTLSEWSPIKLVLDLFCNASSMLISKEKLCFLFSEVEEEILEQIGHILPFNFKQLADGTNYLGFFIKPNDYQAHD